MSEKLLIFQKTYDLLLWLYPVVNRIPKGHRLVLGKNLEELAITLLVSIIKANKSRGQMRANLQSQISDELDCLRIFVRLTKDLRLMSIKKYATA
ncbi:four helix bundle protein, partial [Patescibacteria group bacterium]|nr:four helix bundle protein [Patescibacteria group bacterium]